MPDYYESPRIVYGDGLVFIRVCSKCGRFVTADKTIYHNEETGQVKEPNATCANCGRVAMPFEGAVDYIT